MAKPERIKGSKIATALPLVRQGKYRWSFEYKTGEVLEKYNDDGSKNVYCSVETLTAPEKISDLDVKSLTKTQIALELLDNVQKAGFANGRSDIQLREDGWYRLAKPKVQVPLQDVKAATLMDETGKIAAAMDVPDGAVVFQRRRVRDINYYNRFHNMTVSTPEGVVNGRYMPKRETSKVFPEYTYSECWLIGYRKRESDGSVTVHYNCVYPDGKVESFDAWNVKPWLYEPEWFSEEQV